MNSRYSVMENFKSSNSDRKDSYLKKLVSFISAAAVKALKKEV